MKKIAVLTILFSSIMAASYAQQTTSPVYDNERNEHLIKHEMTPKDMEKYALMDNSAITNNSTPVHRLTFSTTEIAGKSLFKIDASDYSNDLKQYDLKKVTFPKTNYLMHQ